MGPVLRQLLLACLVAIPGLAACSDEEEAAEAEPEQVELTEAEAEAEGFFYGRIEPHDGDLADMRGRGVVRALVTLNMAEFFLLKGRPHGFEYELLQGYEKFLNKGVAKKKGRTQVVFIPVAFEEAIAALREGRGDLVAAGMTITPEREALVAFTEPYFPEVDEIVVAHKDVEGLGSLDALAGRSVTVLAGSSYVEHLRGLSGRLEERGLAPIELVEADPALSSGDLLEMVNAGILEITVADGHIAALWADVLEDLRLHESLKLHSGGKIAWALRKENPELRDSLDAYLAKHKRGTTVGNVLFKRYFEDSKFIDNPLSEQELAKLERLATLFQRYAERYEFDWLACAAQGYQESGLDQKKRSKRGAVGIMQLLPSTAADPNVGIKEIDKLENNIHAGIKYMHFLRERYYSGPELDPENRLAFSLAAYNLGPRRVEKLRGRAEGMGLDPDRWFGNVEMVALARVGPEPVHYVSNIHEYYVAYRLHMERQAAKTEATREAGVAQ